MSDDNPTQRPEPGSAESLAQWNLTPDDLRQARSTGELALTSLQRAYGGEGRRYDIDELAEAAGVDRHHLRMLWRSLGFTEPRSGERVFSDADLTMLSGVIPFLAEGGLNEELTLQMTRVIGSGMARIASSQVDAIVAEFDAQDAEATDSDASQALARQMLAVSTAALLEAMPDVLEFVWQRHLVSAAQRRLLRFGDGDTPMCVGFADLVGFTAHTQKLTSQELAGVVERFEQMAYDIVSGLGGRVVKMIGDEVLFVADDIVTGARIALAVSEAYREDEALSDVRVGMAAGAVLEREGDVYGPVVNLANRIVGVAFPGSVVVSTDVAAALADEPGMSVRSIRRQPLKDIGTVPLWTLRPAASPDHPLRTRTARHHLRQRQDLLALKRTERQQRALDTSRTLFEPSGDDAGAVVGADFVDHATGEIEAITDAVLAADIDAELQVELLADIDAARRLHQLEDETAEKAAEVDAQTQDRLLEIEAEARRKVEEIETASRERVQQVLDEAERRSERLVAEAERRERKVADEVARQAQRAERDALRRARRQAIRASLQRRRSGTEPDGGVDTDRDTDTSP